MDDDDDLAPISALQHWLVCPRQCALIHLEGQWAENRLTAEGGLLHSRVDAGGVETRPGVRSARGIPLRSTRLGLVGKADVVEFHPDGSGADPVPYPVEYKRGRSKPDDSDRVQLCAQALCLEEALGRAVPEGALFYAATRRRVVVPFDSRLRERTEQAAAAVRAMFATDRTPRPVPIAACKGCSLIELCLPTALAEGRVAAYFSRAMTD
jgi:CRISPR-associated exonuclease Cas4